MKVTVGSYYEDDAKGTQREVHITLDENDAKEIFKSGWDNWSVDTRSTKLTAMADILLLKYAVSRGFRNADPVNREMTNIINRDLK